MNYKNAAIHFQMLPTGKKVLVMPYNIGDTVYLARRKSYDPDDDTPQDAIVTSLTIDTCTIYVNCMLQSPMIDRYIDGDIEECFAENVFADEESAKIAIHLYENNQSESEEEKEDVCPVCGGKRTFDYGCAEITDNGIEYPWECKHCKATGKEVFSRLFEGHYDITPSIEN